MSDVADFRLIRTLVADDGAFGVLQAVADPSFGVFTLERTYPAASGRQFVKVPTGTYLCRSSFFHRGGHDTYEVTGVADVTRLLFHKGNVETDSEGCILLGRRRGDLGGVPAVLESALAFEDFMRHTAGRELFFLEVAEVPA